MEDAIKQRRHSGSAPQSRPESGPTFAGDADAEHLADTSSGQLPKQGRRSQGRDGAGPAGADAVGQAGESRLEGCELGTSLHGNRGGQKAHGPVKQSGRALFPPGPAARDEWREILRERPDLAPAVESEVRGMASGTSRKLDFSRADQLRSLGNLVVPIQGACALTLLLKRATANGDGG